MAIAITEFEALCGFKSGEEIYSTLSDYPTLVASIDSDDYNGLKNVDTAAVSVKNILKSLFTFD